LDFAKNQGLNQQAPQLSAACGGGGIYQLHVVIWASVIIRAKQYSSHGVHISRTNLNHRAITNVANNRLTAISNPAMRVTLTPTTNHARFKKSN
jgi:hypothetical protein